MILDYPRVQAITRTLPMGEEHKRTRRQSEKEDEAQSGNAGGLGKLQKAGACLTPPAQEGNKFVLFLLTKLL